MDPENPVRAYRLAGVGNELAARFLIPRVNLLTEREAGGLGAQPPGNVTAE
ncbi:hypothetical protein C8D88_101112 [Lentzea atacamensis]|uniref:Uncharacterized protein n=2 Tax=Lentzea TaxID=165301 RepID=A0A316IBF8_9PSEU|nr:hypothetical protein C8D88_101112 [Lentzea atacamensis]